MEEVEVNNSAVYTQLCQALMPVERWVDMLRGLEDARRAVWNAGADCEDYERALAAVEDSMAMVLAKLEAQDAVIMDAQLAVKEALGVKGGLEGL